MHGAPYARSAETEEHMGRFEIRDDFYLNGEKFQIISGQNRFQILCSFLPLPISGIGVI